MGKTNLNTGNDSEVIMPRVENYSFNIIPDSIVNKPVESNRVGDLVQGFRVRKVGGQTDGYKFSYGHVPNIVALHYSNPYFGWQQASSVAASVKELYDSVVGSALQTTDISAADLTAYIVLSHEWRCWIKDIDRVLKIYKQTNYYSPAYGRGLVNRITNDSRGYTAISGHVQELIDTRNLLAELINTHFPMIKGATFGAYDDMMLDNIYADDPNPKTALICTHRNQYCVEVEASPLVELHGVDLWKRVINILQVTHQSLVEYFRSNINDTVEGVWYTDVKPYLKHLERAGGLAMDTPIKELTASDLNVAWKPVYSIEFLYYMKNLKFFPGNASEDKYDVYFGEDADGLFKYFEEFVHPITLEINKVNYGSDIEIENSIVNAHSMPVQTNEWKMIMAAQPQLQDGDIGGHPESGIQYAYIENCMGGVVTRIDFQMIDEYDTSGTDIAAVTLYSNFVVVDSTVNSFNYYEGKRFAGVQVDSLVTFESLTQLNCMPNLWVLHANSDDMQAWEDDSPAAALTVLFGRGSYSMLCIDTDNLVELSKEMIHTAWARYAYTAFFDKSSSKIVSTKK